MNTAKRELPMIRKIGHYTRSRETVIKSCAVHMNYYTSRLMSAALLFSILQHNIIWIDWYIWTLERVMFSLWGKVSFYSTAVFSFSTDWALGINVNNLAKAKLYLYIIKDFVGVYIINTSIKQKSFKNFTETWWQWQWTVIWEHIL